MQLKKKSTMKVTKKNKADKTEYTAVPFKVDLFEQSRRDNEFHNYFRGLTLEELNEIKRSEKPITLEKLREIKSKSITTNNENKRREIQKTSHKKQPGEISNFLASIMGIVMVILILGSLTIVMIFCETMQREEAKELLRN